MNIKSENFVSVVVVVNERTLNYLSSIESIQIELNKSYSDYEIVCVVQKSVQVQCKNKIEKILDKVPCVRYLQLTNNVSDDVVWASGAENSIGDFVLCFDLEYDPLTIINKSVDLCKKGNDVVVGVSKENSTILYKMVRPLIGFILKMINYRLPKGATSFRCLSRRAVNSVIDTGKLHQKFFMRIQNSGYKSELIKYSCNGEGIKKNIFEGSQDLLRLVVFNSATPLRIISLFGFCTSFFAFVFAIYSLVVQVFTHSPVDGWTSLFFCISIFSMLQFIILSFISEYLARLLDEQNSNPGYSFVFEKNSKVMIDLDRINVLQNSIDTEPNLTQTGRDR